MYITHYLLTGFRQDILRENDWEDSFLSGSAFDRFLREETATVDVILRSIGLVR